jgi:hypothetical protein
LQLKEDFLSKLHKKHGWVMEARGSGMEIKGKGVMQTFMLTLDKTPAHLQVRLRHKCVCPVLHACVSSLGRLGFFFSRMCVMNRRESA